MTCPPLAPALLREYPEVNNSTRLDNINNALIINKDISYYENGIYADEYFFDVFTFPLLQGEEKTALKKPFSIVITENLATRYFGNEDPLGKTLNINEQYNLTITGIVKNPPENSHIQFEFIVSFISLEQMGRELGVWQNIWVYTYFELQEGFPYQELEKKFPALLVKYQGKLGWEFEGQKEKLIIQPLKDIHLHSHYNHEFSQNNDIKNIYLFTAIGLMILIIACINYINLSTARSIKRATEIGLRKVVGAQRIHLVKQFIGESVLLSIIALIIAIFLVILILPSFNSFVDKPIGINLFKNTAFTLLLFGIVLFTGVFSGCYPALFLAGFQPVKVLKSSFVFSSKSSVLRSILVTVQFSISIILIAGTIIVNNQLQYIKDRKLGYNKEHVIFVPLRDSEARQNIQIIKKETTAKSANNRCVRIRTFTHKNHWRNLYTMVGR